MNESVATSDQREPPELLRKGFLPGALAGLVGGLVLGATAAPTGLLATFSRIAGGDSALAGFVVQLVIAALLGAGFSALVRPQRHGTGETLMWGATYGLLWWVVGPLTLLPLLSQGTIAWDVHAAQDNLPAFIGYILFGVTTGLCLGVIRGDLRRVGVAYRGPVIRGVLAGVFSAWLLGTLLNVQNEQTAMMSMVPDAMDAQSPLLAWLIILAVGVLAGGIFAWLYPSPFDGAGPVLVRGTVYGFIWWVIGAQTLMPVLGGERLSWSLSAVLEDFPTLPGFLLFGAALALLYQWLHAGVRLLFADDLGDPDREGIGTQGLRALGRGALAGLIGGTLFTFVMIQIDFLPSVASLVGSRSALTGLLVHLLIANVIGMSYGLLFRLQSYDVGSALGWGVSYGFLWWILGPLTLMPTLLGGTPQWTLAAATDAFPALVGHLAYGAGLGLTFYALEIRGIPWWISRSEAEGLRIARHQEQIATSAPAIWVMVVLIALTLPVLLGM